MAHYNQAECRLRSARGCWEAIERAAHDSVVEMAIDSDESWFRDVYPKLASAIRRIKGAHRHEREPGTLASMVRSYSDDDEYP